MSVLVGQTEFAGEIQEIPFQLRIPGVHALCAANGDNVKAARELFFVQAIDLPEPSFDPVADNSFAELCADRDTEFVSAAFVLPCVQNEPRCCGAFAF